MPKAVPKHYFDRGFRLSAEVLVALPTPALTEQRPPLSETPVEHEFAEGGRISREGAKTLKNG